MIDEMKRRFREMIKEDIAKIDQHFRSETCQVNVYFKKCRQIKSELYKSPDPSKSHISITIPDHYDFSCYHNVAICILHESIKYHKNLKNDAQISLRYTVSKAKEIFGQERSPNFHDFLSLQKP